MSFPDDFLAHHRLRERTDVPAAIERIVEKAAAEVERNERLFPRAPINLLHRVLGVMSEQAAELESLRDKGDQSRPAPAGDLTQIIKAIRSGREAVTDASWVTKATVRELLDRIATELESLRDRGDQPAPRVITEQGELGDLPNRSVVLGADGVAHQASDNGAGLRFWGSEDESYTFAAGVTLPALLIHTPTNEGTPS